MIGRTAHAATVQKDFEGGAQMAGAWFQMYTMAIAVETFRENHAVEWTIEFNVHTHMSLFALDLQIFDLRTVVGCAQWPWIIWGDLIVFRRWWCAVDRRTR